MQTLTQKVTTTLNEFKNDKGKVKQALGATGAVMLFAGGMYGLQTLLKNKPKSNFICRKSICYPQNFSVNR